MKVPAEIEHAIRDCGALVRFAYPWWLRPFLMRGVGAITLGRRIYVAPFFAAGDELERLLRHELQHVRQINKFGILRFYTRYAAEYLDNVRAGMTSFEAYRNISFEREAAAAEQEHTSADV